MKFQICGACLGRILHVLLPKNDFFFLKFWIGRSTWSRWLTKFLCLFFYFFKEIVFLFCFEKTCSGSMLTFNLGKKLFEFWKFLGGRSICLGRLMLKNVKKIAYFGIWLILRNQTNHNYGKQSRSFNLLRAYPRNFALPNVEFNEITFGRFFLIMKIMKRSSFVKNNLKEVTIFDGLFFRKIRKKIDKQSGLFHLLRAHPRRFSFLSERI